MEVNVLNIKGEDTGKKVALNEAKIGRASCRERV